jgi:hypothetical protein
MIKEAIEKIEQMSGAQQLFLSGREYTNKAIYPVAEPMAAKISIDTLTGLVDYLKANVDKLTTSSLMIHVVSFQCVDLLSALISPWKQRETFIRVQCDTLKFPFGNFMDVESFIIRLQSQFVPSPEVDAILKIVGNVSDSVVKQFSDDGVTQQATVKAGVSRVENVAIPNPVTLAPYRTFLEIEQPASKFVFRMRSGDSAPTCALFESDGGNWKNEAILKIKTWLAEKIPDVAIIA